MGHSNLFCWVTAGADSVSEFQYRDLVPLQLLTNFTRAPAAICFIELEYPCLLAAYRFDPVRRYDSLKREVRLTTDQDT